MKTAAKRKPKTTPKRASKKAKAKTISARRMQALVAAAVQEKRGHKPAPKSTTNVVPAVPFTKTFTSEAERRNWTAQTFLRLADQHHKIKDAEAIQMMKALGGAKFRLATGSRTASLSTHGTLFVDIMSRAAAVADKPVSSIDIMAVSATTYDIRLMRLPRAPKDVPDELYLAGLELIGTVKKVPRANLLKALEIALKCDLTNPMSRIEKLKAGVMSAVRSFAGCQCAECAEARSDAADKGISLLTARLLTLEPELRDELQNALDEISETKEGKAWVAKQYRNTKFTLKTLPAQTSGAASML